MATWKQMSALSVALLVGAVAMPVSAQTAPPDNGGGAGGGGNNNGGGGGGGRQRGNFDPAAMRQRMMDNLKQALGSTDDEFTALQPKIEAVMNIQRDVNAGGGMFGGRGGRGGRGGGQGGGQDAAGGAAATPAAPVSAVQQARTDLQAAIDNKDSTADQIKAKLDAYRDARTKAKDDLAKAQADLKSALSQRQEAVLVLRGMLD